MMNKIAFGYVDNVERGFKTIQKCVEIVGEGMVIVSTHIVTFLLIVMLSPIALIGWIAKILNVKSEEK